MSKPVSHAWAAVLLTAGAALLLFAVSVGDAAIEFALLGTRHGALGWGPALFRGLAGFHGAALLAASLLVARRASKGRKQMESAHSRGAAANPSKKAAWLALGLILAAALALRIWQINTCLWFDEVLTYVDFIQRPLHEIVAVFPSQNQHMLYSVTARAAVTVFGMNAGAARLPAALFGVAAIAALYLLGRRTQGNREALLAAALMTVSYHQIWFSQNARGYTALLFFSTISTWLMLNALEQGRTRSWVAYSAALALGLWSHMTMLFVIGAHGLVYLAMLAVPIRSTSAAGFVETGTRPALGRGWRWKALVAWVFAATVSLQLHAVALPEFLGSALHEESLPSEWTNPWWVIKETLARLGDVGLAAIPVMAGLVVLLAGWASLLRRDWRAAWMMVLPAALGGGTMLALGHNLWPRFFFFCMGFFLLLGIRGVFATAERLLRLALPRDSAARWAGALSTGSMILAIAGSAVMVPRCYLPKQDFIGARDFVESSRRPEEPVLAVGLAGVAYQRLFAPSWTHVASGDKLTQIVAENPEAWLVYTIPVQLKAWHPEIWSVIEEAFEPVRVFPGTLGGGDIIVCRNPEFAAAMIAPPSRSSAGVSPDIN